jgi:DNA-directed RNA polymerase subunit RPC12/RpoP
MAWFLNYYRCAECGSGWKDEWSCMCDDDCPYCGARHMSPEKSDDLTEVIRRRGDTFVILRSPRGAEHSPEYLEIAKFSTREEAEAFLTRV